MQLMGGLHWLGGRAFVRFCMAVRLFAICRASPYCHANVAQLWSSLNKTRGVTLLWRYSACLSRTEGHQAVTDPFAPPHPVPAINCCPQTFPQTNRCSWWPHIGWYRGTITERYPIPSLRYLCREVSTHPKWCDTPSWYLVSHRHICAIPNFATYRTIIVRCPPPPIKTSTKSFCDTIATRIARYENYRCWASMAVLKLKEN